MIRIIFLLFFIIIHSTAWRFIPISKSTRPKINVNIWDQDQFKNKKFISITPGGIAGFYSLGIASYLLNNYDLKNYSFIGASAGAWTSLMCCYKHDHNIMIKKLLDQNMFNESNGSVSKLQYDLHDYLTNNYKSEDFDFKRLNICISELKKEPLIVNEFENLERAIDCCIVSSHIPYITSDKLIKRYNNKVVFDGGFSEFPPKSVYNHYVISPNKFNNNLVGNMLVNIINKNISKEVVNYFYQEGYKDAKNNSKEIDNIFDPSNKYINIDDNEFTINSANGIFLKELYIKDYL